MDPGANVVNLSTSVIYLFCNKVVFVFGKLFKPSLTNTVTSLRKFCNYRRKKFYGIGPRALEQKEYIFLRQPLKQNSPPIFILERCPVGQYFDKIVDLCRPCGYGKFQPEEGKFSCRLCGIGLTTRYPWLSNCFFCVSGEEEAN